MVSQMSIPAGNGMAMPWLRRDPRVLSTGPSPPHCGVQAEPANGHDFAVHRLWLFGIYQKRHYGKAAPAYLHSIALSLGVAGAAGFFLGVPQHALVSVRVLAVATDAILRPLLHSRSR